MAQYSSSRAGLYRSLPPALFCNNTFNPGPLFSTLLLHFLYPIIINGVHNKPFKTLASFQDLRHTYLFLCLLVFLKLMVRTPSGPYQSSVQWRLTEQEGGKVQLEPVRDNLPASRHHPLVADDMQGPRRGKGERNVENMQGHET